MTLIFENTPLSQSLDVSLGSSADLLQGAEGRQYRVYALNSAVDPVVKVQTSFVISPDYVRSAVIENLVIDGQGLGVTGILLQNVVKCQIRNVTIKNCEVGIHLRSQFGAWSECNFLKHIRMENVTKGILFTTTGPHPTDPKFPGDSAAFTVIDDVGISLANRSDAVGIQIGGTHDTPNGPNDIPDVDSTLIKPYSARIKANVWLGSNGGTGLKVCPNGELKYAQAHLTVTGLSDGTGIHIEHDPQNSISKQDRVVWHNQFSEFDVSDDVTKKGFMLVTSGIDKPIIPSGVIADIEHKTF